MSTTMNTFSRPFAAAFGAVALFAATLLVSSPASAADSPWVNTVKWGTITAPTEGSASRLSGSFKGEFGMVSSSPTKFTHSGKVQDWSQSFQTFTRDGYRYSAPNQFRTDYSFALSKSSSLTLNFSVSQDASSYYRAFEAPLTLTLTGADGFSWTGTVGGQGWQNVWGNLDAGSYTLSVAGRYGQAFQGLTHMFFQGYEGSFVVGDAQPGDVPLPGALVLLGTALAGAGVFGRKKLKASRAS